MEFNLRKQEFVELIRADRKGAAMEYAGYALGAALPHTASLARGLAHVMVVVVVRAVEALQCSSGACCHRVSVGGRVVLADTDHSAVLTYPVGLGVTDC